MRSRGLVVALAVLLAVAAAGAVVLYTNGVKKAAESGGSLTTVIVATQDIPANTSLNALVEAGGFKELAVPADAVVDGAITSLDEYFAEDCVVEDFPEMPDRARYVGREGVRERDRHFAEIWGDFVIEPVEFIDGGDRGVVVMVAIRGHGKGSGAPIDAPTAFVSELRDGKIARDRAFTSRSQALEAAGLSD